MSELDLSRYRDVACRTLREQSAFGYPAALSVIDAVASVESLWTATVANEVNDVLDGNTTVSSQLPRIDAVAIVKLIVLGTKESRERLIRRLIGLGWRSALSSSVEEPMASTWPESLASALVTVLSQLSNTEIEGIRSVTSFIVQPVALRVLTALAATPETARKMIDPKALPPVLCRVTEADLGADERVTPSTGEQRSFGVGAGQ